MRRPLVAVKTVPEWNQIIIVLIKEVSKIIEYSNRVQLIWIDGYVKNIFSSWNNICDKNNMYNILYLSYMINTISNSKEFSFSGYYIH